MMSKLLSKKKDELSVHMLGEIIGAAIIDSVILIVLFFVG